MILSSKHSLLDISCLQNKASLNTKKGWSSKQSKFQIKKSGLTDKSSLKIKKISFQNYSTVSEMELPQISLGLI